MHIYQCLPLLQLTIDLWNTTTLHKFHIEASDSQEEYYVRSSWHSQIFKMTCTHQTSWSGYTVSSTFQIRCNPPGRGIWWPRGVQCKVILTFWRMQVSMYWNTQIVKKFRWDVPPIRGIWWPRGVLHKVILTFWRIQLRMHLIHSYCIISDNIYLWQTYALPLQSTIHICNTTTPHQFHV